MGMKKEKKHSTIDKGFCYVGADAYKSKNGRGKIGMNEENLNRRMSNLKGKENFRLIAYLEFKNTTKSKLEVIESAMRVGLADLYQHVSNDHFILPITPKTKKSEYSVFSLIALYFGMEEANRRGYEYTVHWVQ